MVKADFLVIGAGVIGVSVARELKRRYPDQSVVVIEKEPDVGRHASGRNSGVIHAGFYYTADSLKARLTREGNHRLRQFCNEQNLPLNECGKLVVATDEDGLAQIDVLLERAKANGVDLQEVDAHQAREIEPRVKVFGGRALWSPTTASSDPLAVVRRVKELSEAAGVLYEFSSGFIRREQDGVITTAKAKYSAGFVINAAGLYADAIAHQFGVGLKYEIVPYKGLYLYSSEPAGAFRTHIYPVPDLRNPFLGVHLTLTVDGHVKAGPTAIPAFWREQYKGLSGFRLNELVRIGWRNLNLLVNGGHDFVGLAVEEFQNLNPKNIVNKASLLAEGVESQNYKEWGRPGIRAQLVDLETRKLVSDFVIESTPNSIHILNAVSPAWTCAAPFAEYVLERYQVPF